MTQARPRPIEEAIRDQVRLRLPRALAAYQRYIRPRITGERSHLELAEWVAHGISLFNELGMHGVRFEPDGVWIEDGEGDLWSYQPGLFGSAMWAEYGALYEHDEIDLLASLLKDRGTLVDVGANAGLHSIKLAKRVRGLKVFAFEPVGSTFEALVANIGKNGVAERIQPQQVALSDRDGVLRLTTTFRVGNFVVPDDASVADRVAEDVPAKRLDDVLADTERVDLIKCDVEGSELGVLRGADQTLQKHQPVAFVEVMERYTRRYGHEPDAVFDYMREHGYRHRLVIGGELVASSGSLAADLERTTNFLFQPSAA